MLEVQPFNEHRAYSTMYDAFMDIMVDMEKIAEENECVRDHELIAGKPDEYQFLVKDLKKEDKEMVDKFYVLVGQ